MEAGFLMRNNMSDRGGLASKGVYIEQVSVFLLKAVKKQQDAFTHLDWKQIGEVQWLSILNLEIILLSILYAACTLNVARVRVLKQLLLLLKLQLLQLLAMKTVVSISDVRDISTARVKCSYYC
ncbi:hypothetical protein Tco_1492719 [Tanacetum coccineum]